MLGAASWESPRKQRQALSPLVVRTDLRVRTLGALASVAVVPLAVVAEVAAAGGAEQRPGQSPEGRRQHLKENLQEFKVVLLARSATGAP
ncbi:MAG: hypothetical protein ACI8WY_000984 [Planctomycetota bacterium]|jgi:hypothetical protein